MRVKICGIQTEEEALAAAAEGAHALGFVFAASPRRIAPEKAASIIRQLPPFVSKTGVFVNEEIEQVEQVARYCGLDTLQLHGDEGPEYCRALRPRKIIKAFPAGDYLSVEGCLRYHPAAILLDTAYRDRRGGGGQTFDWGMALPLAGSPSFPLILAGGLHPGNIFRALQTVQPYGVDLSSGVEENGTKSREKIRALMQEIRRFEEHQKKAGTG